MIIDQSIDQYPKYFKQNLQYLYNLPEDELNTYGIDFINRIYQNIQSYDYKTRVKKTEYWGLLLYKYSVLLYALIKTVDDKDFDLLAPLVEHNISLNDILRILDLSNQYDNDINKEKYVFLMSMHSDNFDIDLRHSYINYYLHRLDTYQIYHLFYLNISDIEKYHIPLSEFIQTQEINNIILNRYESKFPYLFSLKSKKIIESCPEDKEIKKLLSIDSKASVITKRNYLNIIVKKKKNSINIKQISSNQVIYKSKRMIEPLNASYFEMVIFLDTQKIYIKNKKDKFRPLLLNDLKILYPKYRDLILQEYINQGSYIFKDIDFETPLPPITFNECIDKKTLNQLFHNKYKNGHFFNWNKGHIWEYYILLKTLNKIPKCDWSKIIACKDYINEYSFDSLSCFIISYYINHIITLKKYKSIKYLPDREYGLILDYLDMCSKCKKKYNINFKSLNKLQNAHDELMIEVRNKYTPIIKIPKNSKFNKLRKQLPEEFEWIKTKKRLILESVKMHHCVASYATVINQDCCAIYSILWKNKPYTIELKYNKQEDLYYINQISGIHNTNAPSDLYEYIESLLNKRKNTI